MTALFFIVYAGFISSMAFVIVPAASKLTGMRVAARKPEWLATQPKLAERLRRRRMPVVTSRLSGAALLVALGVAAFAERQLDAMTGVLIVGIVAAGLAVFVEMWSHRRLARLVPAPAKREADLASTRHADHVPAVWVQCWHAALVAVLALYAGAYAADLVPFGQAVARMIGVGLLILFSWLANRYARRQAAQPGQRTFGIAVIGFCALVVFSRIAQDFFDAPPFDEVWFWFCFALAMQVGIAVAAIRGIRQRKSKPPGSIAEPLADRP